MPSADNTPDFDSMSPEELMAWMESLAERQGATEGFTTSERVEIDEIDPTTVALDEPGYIPYGMDPDKWKEIQAEEAAQKAARKAPAAPPPAPTPAPVVEVAPAPAPEPSIEAAPAANAGTPDFDSMTPEEMMAWMESLAERQGATEGFTTDERVEIGEIDPTTVALDEPGYIPYGMDPDKWKEMQAKEAAQKAARKAPAAPPPAPKPVVEATPEPEPVMDIPDFALPMLNIDDEETEVAPAVAETDGEDALAWLESLAADQAVVPEMDLSALSAEIEPLSTAIEMPEAENPLSWLESLAQGDTPLTDEAEDEIAPAKPAVPAASPPSVGKVADPIESGVNTVAWLESLAKRQGVSPDELVTSADMEIPIPSSGDQSEPSYTDYTFEAEPEEEDELAVFSSMVSSDDDESLELEDPEAWLEELATSSHTHSLDRGEPAGIPDLFGDVSEDEAPVSKHPRTASQDDVIAALNAGKDVSAEDMQAWMENQFDIAEEIGDDVPEFDPDAPPVKADLPDWLLEQMGTPPVLDEEEEEAEPEPQIMDISKSASTPDWLKEEVAEAAGLPDGIFDAVTDEMPDWLKDEALEDEEEGLELPDEFMSQPSAATAGTVLFDPKSFGLGDESATEMPDWLKDETIEEADDGMSMPDWLVDEVTDEEEEDVASIFADDSPVEPEIEPIITPTMEVEIDTSDPWAEAFELERKEGMADIDTVPDWYAERIAEGSELLDADVGPIISAGNLAKANLEPETELAAGEVEELPDWLKDAVTDEAMLAPANVPDWLSDSGTDAKAEADEAMPDWLTDGEAIEAVDVPDWLKDTLKTDEQEAIQPGKKEAEVKAPQPAAVVSASPVPVPPSAKIDVAAALKAARGKVQSGEVDDSLQDYEKVVRANEQLDTVANDLGALLKDKKHKENPAVYRVLGDALMRKGDLQAALDTYRKALNLL